MGTIYLDISQEMLEWAFKRVGYDKPAAISAFPNLEKWLNGNKKPTPSQLKSFSKKFLVPYGYLFLSSPPEEESVIPMFRGSAVSAMMDINIKDEINIIAGRQNWLSEYLAENELGPLPFVGAYKGCDEVMLAKSMREILGFGMDWAEHFSNENEAVRYFSDALENLGIAVEFSGVVGNSTGRPINVTDCRGFSLVDNYAPFIFVNSRDSKKAQMFTLAHEFAHILTGEGAGYGYYDFHTLLDSLEILCNKAAALFLVPDYFFETYWAGEASIETISKKCKASKIVVARRAYENHFITRDCIQEYYTRNAAHEIQHGRNSRGDFYKTQDKRLGALFQTHVRNAVMSGKLLYKEAYHLTGIKGNTFKKVLRLEVI
ncbi:MAG: ImmA/IrrE family metallo-endopeptidase [Bacteroidales bacterium]|nr:ImmA/IrrE family metallo-endopeptidase [Bacteroidales bacterium]